jgi:hypothetical protein
MMHKLVAYDLDEVKKKASLAKMKTWLKGSLISKDRWPDIAKAYQNNLYTPRIIMRFFLFCITAFGLLSLLGVAALADMNERGYYFFLCLIGSISLLVAEFTIKKKHHYKSGVTEAAYYIGLAFVYFGILGFEIDHDIIYALVAMIMFMAVSIRYLDLLSLIAAIFCFIAVLFIILESSFAMLPFVVIAVFGMLFLISQSLQKRVDRIVWGDHFIVFDTLALLLIYLGGNYFVVRELSSIMMGLQLEVGEEIPFAFIFYVLTLLVPIAYLTWGLLKRQILFIRVSLLVLALAILTMEYYYSLGFPEITITVIGAILTAISFSLIKYLKTSRNGYTREKILTHKWDNPDLLAFGVSQTLGTTQIDAPDHFSGEGGGEFGGGGASGGF